jgi:hypothetical protein
LKKIILAYRRLDFVFKVLDSLVGLNEFDDVVIFHDGLRETANVLEKSQHDRCRSELTNYARTHKNLDVITYKDNIGLTYNLFRCLQDIAEITSNVIIFEEDKLPTKAGMDFIKNQSPIFDSKSLLDTLPLAKYHSPQITNMATLQSGNGNIVIGPELFSSAKDIYCKQNKYEKDFDLNLNKYLTLFTSNRLALYAAKKKLKQIYSWGVYSQDRPDFLLLYTLFVVKGVKLTPGSAESIDISALSTYGKNVNTSNESTERVCCLKKIVFNQRELCETCERVGIQSRSGLSITELFRKSIEYRIKK